MDDSLRRTIGGWAILIVSLFVAIVSAQTDWARIAENEQRATIAELSVTPASQQIHIVEIDAESIAAARQWPWNRDHYARLVRQLDAAGARSIVFDIDFSSHSSLEGDAAFAHAIDEIDASVVLATFSQSASETSQDRLDALPIPALRTNSSLASASVMPDRDARVRRMLYGTITDGTPRPSLSAQIAGAAGAVDSSYAIDFSIDPATIPRHSFIDVERGTFDKQSVAGKDVLVGATAIELGDRYGVPTYGVIPGVTIQALAAETLIAGGLQELGWIPLLAISAIFAFFITRAQDYRSIAVRLAGSFGVILLAAIASYHGAMTVLEGIPGIVTLAVAAAAQSIRVARAQLKQKALIDSETGLPNAMAFEARKFSGEGFVAAAFIKDFDSILAVVGTANIGKFFDRLVDRITSKGLVGEVFRADNRMIAWTHDGDFDELVSAFEALSEALKKPLQVGGSRIDAAMTFGVAAGGELAVAARAASVAASEDKLWHAHEDAEAAIIEQRVSLMGELDQAIEAGQLHVLYQPKLQIATDSIDSVEALVRWEHPERGHLRPDLFIPLAEEANRIEPLTLFVLKQTIADLHSWAQAGIIMSAAVNVSAKLISSERFANTVEQILIDTGVPCDRLIFEVTESAALRDQEMAAKNLQCFRNFGVLISMDDYGTGQSTLSYLQKLPLAELKIDRAFVQTAHEDRSNGLMVRSTIQLAHSLGLRVVCEGVEEEECLQFLREAGCDYAQGYFVSRPLSAVKLTTKLLADGAGQDAQQDALDEI